MAITGRELLDVARTLVAVTGAGEKEHRSAVNRAYYAAFSEASEYVKSRGYRYQRGSRGSHQQVWDYLKSGVPHGGDYRLQSRRRLVASQGEDLLGRRVIADYELSGGLGQLDPDFSIRTAGQMINSLDRIP
jgi:hypothetical protein